MPCRVILNNKIALNTAFQKKRTQAKARDASGFKFESSTAIAAPAAAAAAAAAPRRCCLSWMIAPRTNSSSRSVMRSLGSFRRLTTAPNHFATSEYFKRFMRPALVISSVGGFASA